MADYDTLLDGMTAASQTTAVPEFLMRVLLSRPVRTNGLRAHKAPLGLRLIEAALVADGLERDEVAVVPPERLPEAIGPATRAVLVSSGDPLGLGMNDSTMAALFGGKPYAPIWFERMMLRIEELRGRLPHLHVMFGGPGAWQLAADPAARRKLGIDTLFCGYGEKNAASLVGDILAGKRVASVVTGHVSHAAEVPCILGPTSMGVVEISRGCGLGCPFCTLRSEPMVHFPIEKIVADVRTNVAGGVVNVCLISEDFFRYGADGAKPNPARVLEMAQAVRQVSGVRLVQLDHGNVSSVTQFPPADLKELHDTLTRSVRHEYLWVNIGVETACGELLDASSCRGKLYPFRPEEWEQACEQAICRLVEAGFMPMVSLLVGLPGETEEHAERTVRLVERLRGRRLVIFPILYAPLDPGGKAPRREDLNKHHRDLFRLCYHDFNLKWLRRMIWDNQAGAGVPFLRRALFQLGGRIQILSLRMPS